MTQPAPATREAFEEELHTLAAAFDQTRELLKRGEAIDLSGLDEQINNFCERLMASEDAVKQSLLPGLASLLVQLEQLENQLRRMQDAFERNRAASAYGPRDDEDK